MPTREAVFSALQALVESNVTGFSNVTGLPNTQIKTVSRRMTLPASVPPGDLPALMLWEQPEDTENPHIATPPKRTWSALLVLVIRNGDKKLPGAQIINPILDQIDTIAGTKAAGPETLGGLVSWVKIIGRTVIETGDTDPNGLGGAVVPIKILVP